MTAGIEVGSRTGLHRILAFEFTGSQALGLGERQVTIQELGLLLGSIVASVIGQFLLKAGALRLGKVTAENWLGHLMSMVTTWELVAGMAAYGLGAIAYILLLTRVKLSVAAPSVSLIYVFTVLIGVVAFGEALPIARAIGVALIMAGVVLVASQS